MRGFLTGVAVNIVLSQVYDVTGYRSSLSNKTMRLVDTVLHPGSVSIPTFAFPAALVVSTLVVTVAGIGTALVGDTASIPSALPKLVLPQLGGLLNFLVPALSVAIGGLIQGAGISKAVPNPGGAYSDINRDFIGQGAGIAVVLLLLAPAVELIPRAALGAMLVAVTFFGRPRPESALKEAPAEKPGDAESAN